MRLIPGKTKVKIELFRGITLADVLVALAGLSLIALCSVSSLPGKWIIAGVIAMLFALLIFRLDEEPLYVFLWHMLKYLAYPRRLQRVYKDDTLIKMAEGGRDTVLDAFFNDDSNESADEAERKENRLEEAAVDLNTAESENDGMISESDLSPAERKELLKMTIKEEKKILKSKTATEEEKNAVWQARAERTAAKKKQKASAKNDEASSQDMSEYMPFTGIKDNFIEYGGKYYGSVIEIDPIEFRFFSKYRRDNSIEACFGKVLRGLTGDYGINIVKIQRPVIYDKYLDAEYDKLDSLKKSYESGLLTEQELKARVEIQYDRINEVLALCNDDKVIEPFYYLVFFESDKRRLDIITRQAIQSLEQGELSVRRLGTKGLATFLKYTNSLDFDEAEVDKLSEEQWVNWAMPEDVSFSMRRVVVDGVITHNLRVVTYPTVVGDAWLAGVMSFPSTKVVVKATPMDRTKAVRAIDRSLSELRGQYMATSTDSKMIELQEHIETLSQLLVTLQQDNEALMSVSIYITAYDAMATEEDPLLSENFKTLIPFVSDMKRTLRRSWNEAGMRLNGMDFMQLQSFIGSQVSNYDPMIKESRGIPTNTIAGMFPWIYAHISDVGGIKLGSSDGVPVFIDFFRRDEERVNSNMVIVGKSGSGKSYATKSLLTNLASEDAKIFILDPENEYSELAHTLHGKVINVGNAKYGRLNPFHIITALDDDEAGEVGSGSFATHLQFLEEFFKQILPDIDKDALEYLNSLVERVYLNFGITPDTDLSNFKAEDYPIFDDLYDVVLAEFERTNNEYLRNLLRTLVNYIAKFSTGGRNANIWNGPSTITTDENFSVFNFQSMLANRNSTIANAQMLLVLKYIDNEIIKNRDYNIRYGLNRKIVVAIDEAHVFIDNKFPIALDFMFQLAKRIRKYNGMQIVITQNIKDFVGSEEIARKSTAIINACQYSFIFGLAPNDMNDLCTLYEKAGGINEREQEDILGAKRGQAFTIMSPTSRSSFGIEVPASFVEMFESDEYISAYFTGDEGETNWENFVAESRQAHDTNFDERKLLESTEGVKVEKKSNFIFSEISADEADKIAASYEAEKEEPKAGKKSAVDRFMEAEEAVNRKEYEMATGRFGSINLSETFGDYDEDSDYGSEVTADEAYGKDINRLNDEMNFSTGNINFEKADSKSSQTSGNNGEKLYTQKEIDETLNQFKKSMREEMENELMEKLKWINFGAGLGMASAAPSEAVPQTTQAASQMAASYMSSEDTMAEEDMLAEEEYFEDEQETVPEIESDDELGLDPDNDLDDSMIDDGLDYDEDINELLDRFEDDDDDMEDLDELDEEFEDDYESDDDFEFEDDEDDFNFDVDEDDLDDFLNGDDDGEEYEPAPFLFAKLLSEAAEDYANMGIEERMEENNEEVIEITLEDLTQYVKEQRKKNR